MPLKDVRVTYSLLTSLGEKRRKARKKLTKNKKERNKKKEETLELPSGRRTPCDSADLQAAFLWKQPGG